MSLSMEQARKIIEGMITEDHLTIHSLNVCYAMEAMAQQLCQRCAKDVSEMISQRTHDIKVFN